RAFLLLTFTLLISPYELPLPKFLMRRASYSNLLSQPRVIQRNGTNALSWPQSVTLYMAALSEMNRETLEANK
ncbi:hypothetical protein PFISCL1PPCAC_10685, partial [Pristionchus fissidentatus]